MKNLGMVRKLDDLGRITLPIELRRTFNINERDPLEIYVDNGAICLKPVAEAICEYCESTEHLVEQNGKFACPKCIEEMWKKVKK